MTRGDDHQRPFVTDRDARDVEPVDVRLGIVVAQKPCMLANALPMLLLTFAPQADPESHRFRLHGDLSLANVDLSSYEEPLRPTHAWRLAKPSLGLGFGAKIEPWLWLGASVSGSAESRARRTITLGYDAEEESVELVAQSTTQATTLQLGLDPYVEVRPTPSRRVQPFVLAHAGLGYSRWRATTDGRRGDPNHGLSGRVGGRVGLHAFVLPRLSVDADVGVAHAWNYRRSRDQLVPSSRGVQLSGRIGISGWW